MAMKIEGEFQKDPKDQGYLESSKLSNKKQNPSIASSLMAKEIESLVITKKTVVAGDSKGVRVANKGEGGSVAGDSRGGRVADEGEGGRVAGDGDVSLDRDRDARENYRGGDK